MSRNYGLVLLAAIMIGLAGCGGGSHKSTTTAKSTTTTPSKPKTVAHTLTASVRSGKVGAQFGPSVAARAGDPVQFRIALPPHKSGSPEVTVTIPKGPAKRLSIKARSEGHSADVTVTASGGKKITLQQLRFSCALPPAPTFCPPVAKANRNSTYMLKLKPIHTNSIFLTAIAGPVAVKGPPGTPSGALVPPYTITEMVRAVTKSAKPSTTKQPYAPSATVHPGDMVTLFSHVAGKVTGAPQTVTITIAQGPATSLTVSASIAGGATASATLKSAGKSPIALVLPRYQCAVPPDPTYCPATSIKTPSHKYVLTFSMSPLSPPLVIQATAQAG